MFVYLEALKVLKFWKTLFLIHFSKDFLSREFHNTVSRRFTNESESFENEKCKRRNINISFDKRGSGLWGVIIKNNLLLD